MQIITKFDRNQEIYYVDNFQNSERKCINFLTKSKINFIAIQISGLFTAINYTLDNSEVVAEKNIFASFEEAHNELLRRLKL